MERFAIKINKQVKNNLFKICRLCGIDNPNKIGILEEVVFLSDDGEEEPPLYKKIFNCVGVQVTTEDKMPKTICALCFDKINDFHEFREMCYVTNVQTRKLLGLAAQPKIELKWETNVVPNPVAASVPPSPVTQNIKKGKGKKRKNAEPPPDNSAKVMKLETIPKSEVKEEEAVGKVKPGKGKQVKSKLEKIKLEKSKLEKAKNDKNKFERVRLERGKSDKVKIENATKGKAEVIPASKGKVEANVASKGKTELTTRGKSELISKGKAELTPKGKSELTPKGKSEITPKGKSEITPKGKVDNTPKGKLEKARLEKLAKVIKKEPKQLSCNICQTTFISAALLQSHLLKSHVPSISRYSCVKCNESMEENMHIKSHNLWHKLSKTPYQCGRCDREVNSLQGLTKHMRECVLAASGTPTKILPNVECKFCTVEFPTKNLFFMHSCITVKLRCPKCKCKLSSQTNTLKHIATCTAKIRNESEMDYIIKELPNDGTVLVPVVIPPPVQLPIPTPPPLPKPSLSKSKASKNSVPTSQNTSVITKETRNSKASHTMVVIPSCSTEPILPVPPIIPETPRKGINSRNLRTSANSNASSTSDVASLDVPNAVAVGDLSLSTNGKKKSHVVKENAIMARCSVLLQDTIRALVNIKQEPAENSASIPSHVVAAAQAEIESSPEKNSNDNDNDDIQIENFPTPHIKQEIVEDSYREEETNIEINIKQEVLTSSTIQAQEKAPILPALKLKIKKEHGTLNSSFIQNANSENNETTLSESHKKKKKKTSNKNKEANSKSSTVTEQISTEVQSEKNNENSSTEQINESTTKDISNVSSREVDLPQPILIKEENIDPEYENDAMADNGADDFHDYDGYDSEDNETYSSEKENTISSLPVISNVQSVAPSTSETSIEHEVVVQKETVKKTRTNKQKNTLKILESSAPLMQISSVSSGVNIFDKLKSKETESSVREDNEPIAEEATSQIPQIISVESGVTMKPHAEEYNANIDKEMETEMVLPQITTVSSGVSIYDTQKDEDSNLETSDMDFDYSSVMVKEEPDYTEYYDPSDQPKRLEDATSNISENGEECEDEDEYESDYEEDENISNYSGEEIQNEEPLDSIQNLTDKAHDIKSIDSVTEKEKKKGTSIKRKRNPKKQNNILGKKKIKTQIESNKLQNNSLGTNQDNSKEINPENVNQDRSKEINPDNVDEFNVFQNLSDFENNLSDISTDEDTPVETPVPSIPNSQEYQFDPNIKIKQEIEFTEEGFVEYDHSEYETEDEDYDYENDNDNDNYEIIPTSPIKELCPIDMNIDLNIKPNTSNLYDNPTTENVITMKNIEDKNDKEDHIDNVSNSFGFTKIRLSINHDLQNFKSNDTPECAQPSSNELSNDDSNVNNAVNNANGHLIQEKVLLELGNIDIKCDNNLEPFVTDSADKNIQYAENNAIDDSEIDDLKCEHKPESNTFASDGNHTENLENYDVQDWNDKNEANGEIIQHNLLVTTTETENLDNDNEITKSIETINNEPNSIDVSDSYNTSQPELLPISNVSNITLPADFSEESIVLNSNECTSTLKPIDEVENNPQITPTISDTLNNLEIENSISEQNNSDISIIENSISEQNNSDILIIENSTSEQNNSDISIIENNTNEQNNSDILLIESSTSEQNNSCISIINEDLDNFNLVKDLSQTESTSENIISIVDTDTHEQLEIAIPELANINEIAENHNNENFEKLLRNEVPENSSATIESSEMIQILEPISNNLAEQIESTEVTTINSIESPRILENLSEISNVSDSTGDNNNQEIVLTNENLEIHSSYDNYSNVDPNSSSKNESL